MRAMVLAAGLGTGLRPLADVPGGANRASEVLSRKRRLNVRMIRALHQRFGIPASVLIGDYDADDERAAS